MNRLKFEDEVGGEITMIDPAPLRMFFSQGRTGFSNWCCSTKSLIDK